MGYKLYEVKPCTQDQRNLLEFLEREVEIDVWKIYRKTKSSFIAMIPAFFQHEFERALKEINLKFTKLINGVVGIENGEEKDENDDVPVLLEGQVSFEQYLRYAEIQNYLKRLADTYPDIVTLEHYGVSYESRNLSMIRISTGGEDDPKPIIFVDAGIHAREWIAPAQALYLLHELIENEENRNLIESIDWMIVPLANPDGYEYSHTTDRFWRKTRSRLTSQCKGVDPNRNFDFYWMKYGASNKLRSSTYAGPCPFSEPETRALSRIIIKHADRIKLYLSIHSCRQCIIYPFGFSKVLPYNAEELHNLAVLVEKAICKVNGNHYDIGNSPIVLKKTSGSSRDWVYGVAGVALSYTLELPPGGTRGFDLPPSEIINVVQEIFEGIKVFHDYVNNKYGHKMTNDQANQT